MEQVETITIRVPFELKVWLADYARRRRETMTAMLVALIQGLRDAEKQETETEGA